MNIDVISVEFGYWATPRYETEFPRVAAGFAEMKCDRMRPISDELGMEIDGYLGVIRKVTPELYDVFVLTYIKRWEKQEIWRYLHISRREYFNRLKTVKTSLLLLLSTEGKQCLFIA